tara:strand:- start:410 stop:988 length:579 start_codon:yes stop_codon:yes gene_type:complete
MDRYIKFADSLSVAVGKAFSWCIVILCLGTCYEVLMAYVFNKPTLWNFDFSLQMYGAIFMMAGAYTLSTQAHVRGDVLYRLMKTRTQAKLDLILYIIFFFPGVLALTFYGLDYAGLAWKIKETSWNSPAQIQIYMAKSLIPLSGLLLTLQGVAEVFRCLNCLKSGKWEEREDEDQETEKILMKSSENKLREN